MVVLSFIGVRNIISNKTLIVVLSRYNKTVESFSITNLKEKPMSANSATPAVPQATPEDIQAITQVSRDYVEGWFTADAARMSRALHPELVKRSIWHDLQEDTWKVERTLTAEAMVGFTRSGGGSAHPENEKAYDIEILDVFRHIATVKASSYPYMDYLHLAKMDGRWWIVNVLYEVRQGEQTDP